MHDNCPCDTYRLQQEFTSYHLLSFLLFHLLSSSLSLSPLLLSSFLFPLSSSFLFSLPFTRHSKALPILRNYCETAPLQPPPYLRLPQRPLLPLPSLPRLLLSLPILPLPLLTNHFHYHIYLSLLPPPSSFFFLFLIFSFL